MREVTKRVKPARKYLSAALIRELAKTDMSQADLARVADVPRDSISKYARGVSYPNKKRINQLARALHVDPTVLAPVEKTVLPESFDCLSTPLDDQYGFALFQASVILSNKTCAIITQIIEHERQGLNNENYGQNNEDTGELSPKLTTLHTAK